MALRSFTALIVLLLSQLSLNADDELQLKSSREFWKSLVPILRDYTVNFERDDNAGQLYESGEFIRQGQYSIYTSVLHNGNRQVAFTNPNYQAIVAKKPLTIMWKPLTIMWPDWKVRNCSQETADAIFQDMFIMQIINPGNIREALFLNEVTARTEVFPENAGLLIQFNETLPDDSQVHPAYAGAQLRVFGLNAYPSKIELVQSKKHGGLGTRLEYGKFSEQFGVRLPGRVVASNFQPADGKLLDTNVYRYFYMKSVPIDQQRCTLTYYGIKEPEASERQ